MELTSSDRSGSDLLHVTWKPTAAWGLALGLLFFLIVVKMQDPSTFLYFQF